MNRLKTTLTAVLLSLCMGVTSAIAGPIVIKFAHPNVPQHPMGQAFIKFKELMEERSDGAFRVDIFDSSKFGNFDSVVQGLQLNILQMGSASPPPTLPPFQMNSSSSTCPFFSPTTRQPTKSLMALLA